MKLSLFVALALTAPLSSFAEVPFLEDVVYRGRPAPADHPAAKMTVFLITMRVNNATKAPAPSFCSGTLLANDLVLTAAHCVADDDQGKTAAVLAAPKLEQSAELLQQSVVAASSWKQHSKYRVVGGANGAETIHDLALVKLRSPIRIADSRVATLPAKDPFQGEVRGMVVAGFGLTDPNNQSSFGQLYVGEARGFLQASNLGGDFQIFTQSGGSLICPGDSGGPMFMQQNNEWLVVGVHSTAACGRMAYSTSVYHNMGWIRQAAREMQ